MEISAHYLQALAMAEATLISDPDACPCLSCQTRWAWLQLDPEESVYVTWEVAYG